MVSEETCETQMPLSREVAGLNNLLSHENKAKRRAALLLKEQFISSPTIFPSSRSRKLAELKCSIEIKKKSGIVAIPPQTLA